MAGNPIDAQTRTRIEVEHGAHDFRFGLDDFIVGLGGIAFLDIAIAVRSI
jgi:hypothetical protein